MSSLKSPPKIVWCDLRTIVGLAWLLGFGWFFNSFHLPNNHESRWLIWPAVPERLLDLLLPLADDVSSVWSLTGLMQRLPAIGAALLMVGAACGMGQLVLRALKLSAEMTAAERWYFAAGVGLSLGSLIILGLGLAGVLSPEAFWVLTVLGNAALVWSVWQQRKPLKSPGQNVTRDAEANQSPAPRWLIVFAAVVCIPLLWAMLLGALTPQTDFDVLEYHLNGPKEWFQRGRISFLPHNIYTSFPFLTEMWLLSGMVLLNDWNYGALAGQAVLMTFAPLTALGLYCAGRRWFSPAAGWLAALVFLTTPWTYRISIIAYAEGGMTFYLFAAFFAAQRAMAGMSNGKPESSSPLSTFVVRYSSFLLPGFLAGSAMACKYPGLPSVVLPIALGIAAITLFRRPNPARVSGDAAPPSTLRQTTLALLAYGVGTAIAVGPWLAKNLAETGNPVYPLAYAVFGGRDITPELNAKWKNGHKAATYPSIAARLRDSVVKLADVVANNDWHSPLLYGLAPLSLFWTLRRREILWAWLFAGWLFLVWFLFTHHIDRFWIPMIPVIALLSGAGGATLTTPVGRWVGGAAIVAAIAYNMTISSLIGGYNAGLSDLQRAEQIVTSPEINWMNQEWAAGRLPADLKVLFIGDAATFHARFPVLYNTVFDRSLLEEWCAAGPGPEFPLKPVEEIRRTFQEQGVTHLYVDWSWILRYREPHNYGYTDFVSPARLRQLQELGILDRPLRLPPPVGIRPLDEQRQEQLTQWHAPELITRFNDQPCYFAGQIYPIRGKSNID